MSQEDAPEKLAHLVLCSLWGTCPLTFSQVLPLVCPLRNARILPMEGRLHCVQNGGFHTLENHIPSGQVVSEMGSHYCLELLASSDPPASA